MRHLHLALVLLATTLLHCGSDKAKSGSKEDDDEEDEPRKRRPVASASATNSVAVTRPSAAPSPVPVPIEPPPAPAAPSFKIDKTEYAQGDSILVTFNTNLVAPAGEQYWITLVKPEAAESEFAKWKYLPPNATSFNLTAEDAGDFEVRLHDLYPKYKQGRVLARQRIKVVKAAAAPAGPYVPSTGFCSSDGECRAGYYCGQQGNCFPREAPKKTSCSLGKSYWGPCERTGCQAGYTCSDRDRGGDGNCYCNK